MKKFKSNRKGTELTGEKLNDVSGGHIVNINEHPEAVPNSMPEKLANKSWGANYAIFVRDNLVDFAKTEEETKELDERYHSQKL